MKITKPFSFFSIYMLASCLLIMVFRFFVPTNAIPLPIYSTQWRFVGGFLDCFYFFPALVFSGLVILFGLQKNPQEEFKRFSPGLLAYLKAPIIMGIAATLVYTLLFFLAAPLAHDFVSILQLRGELYTQSKAGAVRYADQGEWPDAYQFMRVCDSIWPENPENESLWEQIEFGMDSWRLSSSLRDESNAIDETVSRNRHPLGQDSVSATDALVMADTAFGEGRYYDSHWLAVLAGRLARQGSVEAAQAQRLASLAWNALGALTPSVQEEKAYYLYRQKREGYEAVIASDWVRAYYTFKALSSQLPSDPDVANFLALSEESARKSSFFVDEVDEHVGEMLSGVIFSLPFDNGGRAVLRVFSLSTMPDISYGTGFELMAFSADGTLRYDLTTPYVKILPIRLDGTEKLLILLRALSRENEEASLDPVWSGGERPSITNADLILDVSYGDFLLLSRLRRGLDALSIDDLFTALDHFGDYGYITKVFEAELIYRLSEPGAMLSLVMLIIIVGWCFRSSIRPKYLGVPMLFILPLVFNGLLFCFRKILNILSITSVIAFSFSTALIMFGVGLVCSFILCLILVSAQHG
ncbi:MAG: hypothetical protein LBK00_09380 [Treponema sp.]|jgi:hypothetical protein|nr:hypothetical protein [Treponema sp.]